jgi:hypothetical protein
MELWRQLFGILHFDTLGHDNKPGISFMLPSNASAIIGKILAAKVPMPSRLQPNE